MSKQRISVTVLIDCVFLQSMLSRKTKYGIKALTCIARHYQNEDTMVKIADISTIEHISRKYLESILLELRKAGLLGARKGKGGGYYLIKPPDEILMADVIRVLEGPIAMLPCVSLNYYERCEDCPDEVACGVHRLMLQVRDNTLEVLQNNSLADLL